MLCEVSSTIAFQKLFYAQPLEAENEYGHVGLAKHFDAQVRLFVTHSRIKRLLIEEFVGMLIPLPLILSTALYRNNLSKPCTIEICLHRTHYSNYLL